MIAMFVGLFINGQLANVMKETTHTFPDVAACEKWVASDEAKKSIAGLEATLKEQIKQEFVLRPACLPANAGKEDNSI